MQSDPISKYTSFDFSNSNWQTYLANLYPSPNYTQIEKVKRKWYKANIDSSFDMDYDEKAYGQNPTANTNTQQIPIADSNLYQIEGFLKLLYIPGVFIMPGFYLKIMVAIICIMALIRNYGKPKFSKEYGSKLIPSEFTANLLYLISISVHYPQNSLLFFLPISIHLSSGIVEFASRNSRLSGYLRTGKIKEVAETIKNNRNALIVIKNKVEFGLLAYFLLTLILGLGSFFQMIIYVQFISIKNKFNNSMQYAIQDIRNDLMRSPLPGFLKGILMKIYDLVLKVINFI